MSKTPHLDAFLDAARYFIGAVEIKTREGNYENTFAKGSKGEEIFTLAGYPQGTAWCAIFITACAARAKILGVVIAKNSYAIGIQQDTVAKCGGTWIDGPLINGGVPITPMPGDLVTFGDGNKNGHGAAKHVGIVETVSGDTFTTIEGNTCINTPNIANECGRVTYRTDYSRINAFVRPDWSKVGDIIEGDRAFEVDINKETTNLTYGPLYENKNDRHDMTLRQVGYLNNYALSNTTTGIAISVINYTTVLGDLYDIFAPMSIKSLEVETSALEGNYKIAVDYFLSQGFSASASCAISACLQAYSGLNPSYSNYVSNKYLYGIGAWSSTKMNESKSRVSDPSSWNTDLSAQLDYVQYDLYTNYPELLVVIKKQPLNTDAVEHTIDLFMDAYNPNYSNKIESAKNYAFDAYNRMVIIAGKVVGNTVEGNYKDITGQQLTAQYCREVPQDIQCGLQFEADFTSYSHWFYKWASSSYQKALSRIWEEQGFPCERGIAKIGGFFCVAVKPIFGNVGEVIEVVLEDGNTFAAIIADQKGDDAKSPWGHPKTGGISIIEWERVKTNSEGGVIRGAIGSSNVDKEDKGATIGDWYGKKILRITNYGKYVTFG